MTLPRRIVLTGADGFVGQHLRAALAAAYPGAAIATPPDDVRDAGAMAAMIGAERPEVCVHLAAVAAVADARLDEDQAWQVNLHGTLNVARAILRHAPDCQLLFASSADAYGGAPAAGGPIDESAPLAPRSVYAATKAAADLALGSMAEQGLRAVRLRAFNHTGAGQSPKFVVPAFARQIARIAAGLQAPAMQVGNLEAWRDFLDVRDVCAAYVACVSRREALPPGVIVNIGSGQSRRVGDVLSELIALAGISVEVRTDPTLVRAGDVARTCADITRARSLLGWSPTTSWPQTLRGVLDDWRARVVAGEA